MNVVLGRYRRAVERGGLEMPLPERGDDLLINAVSDSLDKARFDNRAAGVNRHFDDDIALQIGRKLRAGDRRVGEHSGVSHSHFMTCDRAVDCRPPRRTRADIVVGEVGVGRSLYMILR